jgi:hypothetical protein
VLLLYKWVRGSGGGPLAFPSGGGVCWITSFYCHVFVYHMTDLRLEYPPDEARELVKEAFRRTEGISSIEDSTHQIVGKTGVSFPRVLWSYGESVYVDFSDPAEDGAVPIEVWADKSVWMNIGADPEKFKRRFLEALEDVRDRPIEDLQNETVDFDTPEGDSPSTGKTVGYIAVTAVVTLVWLMIATLIFEESGLFDYANILVLLLFIAVVLTPGTLLWTKVYPN